MAQPEPQSPPRPGRTRRFTAGLIVGLLVLLAVAGGVGVLLYRRDPRGQAALTGALPARIAPSPGAGAANGVFVGAEAERMREYQKWFGGNLDRVVEFANRDTWSQIADPTDLFDEWTGTRYRMVFSLALLPEQDPSATIEIGASGAYDRYYRQLAQNLIKAGMSDAILRLGWEFNLGSSRWSSSDPKAFISYWRHVVAAIRSVPGQKFEFDWNPNNGKTSYDAVRYYPGNDVVDYIGIDAYDVSWAWGGYPYPSSCDSRCRARHQKVAWSKSIYGGRRGLKFWSDFARHKGKPMSFPEWGLWSRPDGHGGGNDAGYLTRMHAFIADPANDVAYQAYFEFDGPDGPHRLMTTFASSGDTFRALFARP